MEASPAQYHTLKLSTASCGSVIIRYRKPPGQSNPKLRPDRYSIGKNNSHVTESHPPAQYSCADKSTSMTKPQGIDLMTSYAYNNTGTASDQVVDEAFENLPDLLEFSQIWKECGDKDLNTQISDSLQDFCVQAARQYELLTTTSHAEWSYQEDSNSSCSPDTYDQVFNEIVPVDSGWNNCMLTEGPATTEEIDCALDDSCLSSLGQNPAPKDVKMQLESSASSNALLGITEDSFNYMMEHPESADVMGQTCTIYSDEMIHCSLELQQFEYAEDLLCNDDQTWCQMSQFLAEIPSDMQHSSSCSGLLEEGPINNTLQTPDWSSIWEYSVEDVTGECTISDNQPIVELQECKDVEKANITLESIDDFIRSPDVEDSRDDCASSHNPDSEWSQPNFAKRCKRLRKKRLKRVDYQSFLNRSDQFVTANYNAVDDEQVFLNSSEKVTKSNGSSSTSCLFHLDDKFNCTYSQAAILISKQSSEEICKSKATEPVSTVSVGQACNSPDHGLSMCFSKELDPTYRRRTKPRSKKYHVSKRACMSSCNENINHNTNELDVSSARRLVLLSDELMKASASDTTLITYSHSRRSTLAYRRRRSFSKLNTTSRANRVEQLITKEECTTEAKPQRQCRRNRNNRCCQPGLAGRKPKPSVPLPVHAVSTLRKWFDDHIDFPFADRQQKIELVCATGLRLTQVENWLSNLRHKLKIKKADYIRNNNNSP